MTNGLVAEWISKEICLFANYSVGTCLYRVTDYSTSSGGKSEPSKVINNLKIVNEIMC